jgi:hypothetical protein
MRTSCISHPPRSRLILCRETHLKFCGGDHCAAMLLSVKLVEKLQDAKKAPNS